MQQRRCYLCTHFSAKFEERFVIPAAHREQAIEMMDFTGDTKGDTGFGIKSKVKGEFEKNLFRIIQKNYYENNKKL